MPPDPDDAGEGTAPPAARPTRGRPLLITLAVIGVLVIGFWIFAGFYTDLLWFRSVGYSSVFQTELKTRLLMFVVFGGVMAASVTLNCWLAYRMRPAFRGLSAEQQGLDRYRVAIDPYRRLLTGLVAAGLGLITGVSAAGRVADLAARLHSQPFHTRTRSSVSTCRSSCSGCRSGGSWSASASAWSWCPCWRRSSRTTCTAASGSRRRGRRPPRRPGPTSPCFSAASSR